MFLAIIAVITPVIFVFVQKPNIQENEVSFGKDITQQKRETKEEKRDIDLIIEDFWYEYPYYLKTRYCNYGKGVSDGKFLIKTIANNEEFSGNSFYPFSVPAPQSCEITGGLSISLLKLEIGKAYEVKEIIDWENKVMETNENNNELIKILSITKTAIQKEETPLSTSTEEIPEEEMKLSCSNHAQCSQACTNNCPKNVYGCCNGCFLGQCIKGSCQCIDAISYCSSNPNYQVGSICGY